MSMSLVTNASCKRGRVIKLVSFMMKWCFEPFYCILLCCKQTKAHYHGEEKSQGLSCVRIPTGVGWYVKRNLSLFCCVITFNVVCCPEVFGLTRNFGRDLSYKILTFGFTIGKLLHLYFRGLAFHNRIIPPPREPIFMYRILSISSDTSGQNCSL